MNTQPAIRPRATFSSAPANASWRCSGANASASERAAATPGAVTRASGVPPRSALGPEPRPARSPALEKGLVGGDQHHRAVGAVLGLARRGRARSRGLEAVTPSATTTGSTLGRRQAIDPDAPADDALGLVDVCVAGARDHLHGSDRLGAVGERGNGLGPADCVDLIHLGDGAGGEGHGARPARGAWRVATAMRLTPATLAGTQHMSTEDG